MKFPLCVSLAALGLLSLSVSAKPLPPINSPPPPPPAEEGVFFLGVGGWEVHVVSTDRNGTTRPFAEDCQEFCSYTYPEHTYPEPANFKACTAGCRSAQLDAFIAWPVVSNPVKCEQACREMYSLEDRVFACSTGCQTPTIDSEFPNRSRLYHQEDNATTTAEIDLVLAPADDTFSYFLDSFFWPQVSNSPSFDDLTEHAQSLEILMVPYLRSDVTLLTDDGIYTYREYSFDNKGDSLLSDVDRIQEWNPYQRSQSCAWLLHRPALNKLLLLVSIGLTIVATAACCLSACTEDKKKHPRLSSIKTSPSLSSKKAPYDLGAEALPEKAQLSFGQLNNVHKITVL